VTIEVVEEGGEEWTGSGRRRGWPMDGGRDQRDGALEDEPSEEEKEDVREITARRGSHTLNSINPNNIKYGMEGVRVQSRSFKSLFNGNCNRNPSTSV
jgi:hypothetical protein